MRVRASLVIRSDSALETLRSNFDTGRALKDERYPSANVQQMGVFCPRLSAIELLARLIVLW